MFRGQIGWLGNIFMGKLHMVDARSTTTQRIGGLGDSDGCGRGWTRRAPFLRALCTWLTSKIFKSYSDILRRPDDTHGLATQGVLRYSTTALRTLGIDWLAFENILMAAENIVIDHLERQVTTSLETVVQKPENPVQEAINRYPKRTLSLERCESEEVWLVLR